MSLRIFMYRLLTIPLVLVLGGCETLTALGTHEKCGEPGGEVKVIPLLVRKGPDLEGPDPNNGEMKPDLAGLPQDVVTYIRNTCTPGLPLPGELVPELAPTVIPIALAAFQIAYNEGTGAIQGYVEKKRKRFIKSYGGRVNISDFHLETESGTETGTFVRCVRLIRSLPAKIEEQQGAVAEQGLVSDLIVRFKANSNNTAMTLEPLYMKLDSFAASTAPAIDGDVVKASITVGISMINDDQRLGEDPIAMFEQNILVARVERGKGVDFSTARPSAFMPLPKGRPVTVAIAVTETGSGVQKFEGFSDDFKTNSKIIGDALGNILKDRLTEGD